jgi:ammonia channel protein AmtB
MSKKITIWSGVYSRAAYILWALDTLKKRAGKDDFAGSQ